MTIALKEKKTKQGKIVLEDSDLDYEYFENFSWAVRRAFSSPLDLCRFEEGDTLYNTKKAYLSPWSEALKHVRYGIQITFPPRAIVKRSSEEDDTIFESNWRSPVEFDLLIFENEKSCEKKHFKSTQGTLYQFLWQGDLEILLEENVNHTPPKRIKYFKNIMEHTCNQIINELSQKYEFTEVFFMPYDNTSTLARNKYSTLREKIQKSKMPITTIFARPIGDTWEVLAPTLQVVCVFGIFNKNDVIYNLVKDSFYKPSKGRKTERDMFNINAHGIIKNKP